MMRHAKTQVGGGNTLDLHARDIDSLWQHETSANVSGGCHLFIWRWDTLLKHDLAPTLLLVISNH